jgi:hypothetical protein
MPSSSSSSPQLSWIKGVAIILTLLLSINTHSVMARSDEPHYEDPGEENVTGKKLVFCL